MALWPFGKKSKPAPARRQYAGARYNRMLSDWVASSTSQDTESRMALRTLRNRVREQARNNDYVANALRTIQNNVVGNGVKLQSQATRGRGPGAGKLDTNLNRSIEEAWAAWGKADSCHTAGILSFPEIERLAARSVAQDGEIFIRMVKGKFGKSKVALALEVLEADYLDENYNAETSNGNQIRMGVEMDTWNRPVAYHFFTKHPGDITHGPADGVGQRRIRIPAAEVIHLYRVDRAGQTRGVPWFASALTRLRHMSGYEEASVIAARASACQMGFIETPDPDFEGEELMDGERVTSFEPGRISTLGPGERFTAFSPSQPGNGLDPFMRFMLRGVAAGVGLSYETLSKDYSQSNYSSSRLALLDDRDTWRQLQQWLISVLHQRVFCAWLEMAALGGALSLPGYETAPEKYEAVRWIARGWQWVDPAKEISAYKTAVRSGFMTLTDAVAQNGGDFEELAQARSRELELCDELELIFDTDPELTTEQGQAQPAPVENTDATEDENTASSGSNQSEAQGVVD